MRTFNEKKYQNFSYTIIDFLYIHVCNDLTFFLARAKIASVDAIFVVKESFKVLLTLYLVIYPVLGLI